jgi:hypothetical protein
MKQLLFILSFASLIMFACNYNTSNTEAPKIEINYDFEYFGATIDYRDGLNGEQFLSEFSKEEDSIYVKLQGEISTVCQKKGCWMNMALNENKELFVRFKDYDFFVPLNCSGREAVIEGWAYKEVISVEELKHFAYDEGLSEEEIDAITEPKETYSFMAEGVVIM